MKRGILVLLFILLLACSVNAMTVTLDSPATSTTFTNEVPPSLICTATIGADELLSNLTLYFKNNESTVWHADYIEESMPGGGTKIFSVSGLVNATYEWNCLAISNDSVETWAGSNSTFSITFTTAAPVTNNPPSCTAATDTNKTTNEDTGVDIDTNMGASGGIECTDGDGDSITYTISTESGVGTFSITGSNLSAYPEANATGEGYATIKVDDGKTGGITYIDVKVTWTAVNDAPYLKEPVINKTWDEGATSKIDLDEYFSDVDDSAFNYSYTFTSSSPININVVIEDDGDAVFTPETNWTGIETLTFTAYDSANLSATSNEVTLTVQESTAANNPPVIDTVNPTTDPTISVGESQTFKITKSDPDSDAMNVTWYVDGISQEGKTGDSFTYTATTIDSFVIKVAVSDGQESDTHTWALTVKSAQLANQTAPPAEKKVGENVTACGDNECSGDEDQLSCCKDCGCPEGYTCNADTGKCTKEKKAGNIILLAVVLGLFVGGAGVGLYVYKKKQEQEIFGGLANTPFEPPPKTEEAKKEGLIVKKPQEPVKKAAEEKPFKETKTTSQVLLKNYIITNLKKGKTLDQVKEELHKVGWTEEQINDAYTAAQLDEAFS